MFLSSDKHSLYVFLVSICLSGTKHKKFQEPTLANSAELQQWAEAALDWHTTAEQPHGTVVPHALPHAFGVLISLRLQGVVLKSFHRDG